MIGVRDLAKINILDPCSGMNMEKANSSKGNYVRLPAPAKLNLMLRILEQRPDGYHSLQTVFQFIDLCDYISFRMVDSPDVQLKTPIHGVPEQQDLCVRAGRILQREGGCQLGVEIDLEKNLPIGGGLGGGSSDAATTLLALNRLWGLNLPQQQIMRIGLELGADVPVFIKGLGAWAEGVGENLTTMELAEPWYVILAPDCKVSTAQVFNSPLLTRNNDPVTMPRFIAGWQENDCTVAVTEMYPLVKSALNELSVFGRARLTGTGACVFAAFESESTARQVESVLSARWNVFVSKGLNRSPLLDRLV